MVQKYKKVLEFANFSVPLHPLFGVIAGRKTSVACYVAHETIQQTNKNIIISQFLSIFAP